jgi:preprotein translocase subunit SecY
MGKGYELLHDLFRNLFAKSTVFEDQHGPDLRHRILYTILLLFFFRILADIPALNVDEERMQHLLADNPFLGLVDLFAGGEVLTHFSIVAAGIFPYLVALVIAQAATWVVPSLRTLRRQGEEGKKKIAWIATGVSVPLAFIFALAISHFLARQTGLFPGRIHWFTAAGFLPSLWIVCLVTGGSVLSAGIVNWITRKGVGPGEDIVLLAGASLALAKKASQGVRAAPDFMHAIEWLAYFLVAAAVVVVLSLWLGKAERRIPIVFPKRALASRRGGNSIASPAIPLLLNSGGILPVSAAIGLLTLLGFAGTFLESHFAGTMGDVGNVLAGLLKPASDGFWLAFAGLIVLFTYICNFATIWPQSLDARLSLAEEMRQQGTFIPGLRPGAATAAYLSRTVARISLLGGLGMAFLAAGLPYLILRVAGQDILLTVVSLIVVAKTIDGLQSRFLAHRSMESYDGLVRSRKRRV